MPSPVVVRTKVPPYIKKFLLAKSVNKTEPVLFCRHHPYGKLLIDKVTSYNRLTCLPLDEKDNVMAYFFATRWKNGETIAIQLPFNNRKNVLFFNYFSQHRQKEFLSAIKEDFYHELYWYLVARRRKGVERKEIIRSFMDKYDITEDDISFESIYRQTSRILQPFLNNN